MTVREAPSANAPRTRRAPSIADAPYPVVGACRRDASDASSTNARAAANAASPPRPIPMEPATSSLDTQQALVAAGVPLPWSARRATVKLLGAGAMAFVACVLASAFARGPGASGVGIASASTLLTPRTLVTTTATRTARGRAGGASVAGATADVAGEAARGPRLVPAAEPAAASTASDPAPIPAAPSTASEHASIPAAPRQGAHGAFAHAKTASHAAQTRSVHAAHPASRGAEPGTRASDTAAVAGLAASSASPRHAGYQRASFTPPQPASHRTPAKGGARHAPKSHAKKSA